MKMACDAAATTLKLLQGEAGAAREYDASNHRAFAEYRQKQDWYYSQELRWPESRFWSRRQPAQSSIRQSFKEHAWPESSAKPV
jgi:hypothetical protein